MIFSCREFIDRNFYIIEVEFDAIYDHFASSQTIFDIAATRIERMISPWDARAI